MNAHVSKVAVLASAVCIALVAGACNDNSVNLPSPTVYAEAPFSFKVAVGSQTRATLQGINGRIAVAGFAQLDSFLISGRRRVGSSDIQDARDHLDLVQVEIADMGDELQVRTEQPAPSSGRSYQVDYEIHVPATILLSLDNGNGEINVLSVQDSLSIHGVNGDITLRNIKASVGATTTNGRITADVALPTDGSLELLTTNGNVSLEIPGTTSANLTANLSNGTITVHDLAVHDVETSSTSFSGRLGTGQGVIRLRTVNGNIVISGI